MTREEIKGVIIQATREYQMQELLPDFDASEIVVERPADEKNGDYYTNVALKIAPLAKKSPLKIAQILSKRLKEKLLFAEIKIAPPGFINFYLLKEYLCEQVEEILEDKENYGWLNLGQGEKIQIEFISANPTGPLTLGNGRGGFFGDVLANVMAAAKYEVKREYLINDAGYQIEVLGHSILKDEKAQYRGEYIEALAEKFENEGNKNPKEIGQQAARYIMETMIKPTVEQRMKIKFDGWTSESELRQAGLMDKVLEYLKQKGLSYEHEGALWFKSSQFGDDKNRVLVTSNKGERDSEATYILPDAAYHYKKFAIDKFDKVINIWGADHHGYVARLKAAKKALGLPGKLEIIIMQMVRLFEGGKEVKMSKRAGTYVTLDELLDEIPLDVARFFFLMYSPDTHMDFNLDLAREHSQKNPVYYVQYAYARISSILKKSGVQDIGAGNLSDLTKLLAAQAEFSLIRQLMRMPEIIQDTAGDYQAQRLPQYALDLVRAFHKFYEECRVISENENLTQARLGLVEATRIVLKNTLDLMGISAPEKM
ncbi:arginine--tRNA ligase [Patescibacteria group bacterium]|nr:arginine--tRNA ligase [Patescibacteria group bacterium]